MILLCFDFRAVPEGNRDSLAPVNRYILNCATPKPYVKFADNAFLCFHQGDELSQPHTLCFLRCNGLCHRIVEQYSNVSISHIRADEIDTNRNFFFWGKGLLDLKQKKITYPYFFISRDIADTIIQQLAQNKIHLIYGGRVSGKSYLLADVYSKIRDRTVIFLDGKSRLSEKAFTHVLEGKNTVVLLDIGAINRDQFERILLCAENIHKNGCNFVICVNSNDSDMHGIIKWKIKQNPYINNYLLRYTLSNKFREDTEIDKINKLMPPVNLPQYSHKRTLLDQLIYTEKMLKAKGQYSSIRLKISSSKQLALLIILAIKESIYSSEIVNFAFHRMCTHSEKQVLNRAIPFLLKVHPQWR